MLNKENVKELFRYDSDTGKLYWKWRSAKWFNKDKHGNTKQISWNKRYAGNEITVIDSKGYLQVNVLGKIYRGHRIVWLYVHGEWPNIIDHKNGIRTDNRIVNLANTNQQGNHLNQRMNLKNTSGVTGVYFNKRNSSWCAQMKFNGKTYHLGSSKSLFDVVCLRKSEELKLGFSVGHGMRAKKC